MFQASLPQLSVKLDNIIKTQMGQKYLKYESKTAATSSSSGQPDLPVPGFISKQLHKEPEVSFQHLLGQKQIVSFQNLTRRI